MSKLARSITSSAVIVTVVAAPAAALPSLIDTIDTGGASPVTANRPSSVVAVMSPPVEFFSSSIVSVNALV
jgi:hypothetical protein